MIGEMYDTTKVENCYSALNLTVNSSASTFTNPGGLVGGARNSSSVTNSNAGGTITVTSTTSSKVKFGGICGSAEGSTFTNCEFNGVIKFNQTGTAGNITDIGGFAGSVTDTTELNNCRSGGLITVDHETTGNFGLQPLNIGGFIGFLEGTISWLYSTVSIEVNINSRGGTGAGSPKDTEWNSIGGFAGKVGKEEEGKVGNTGKVSECYAAGSITISSTDNDASAYFVGGFVGISHGAYTFEDCYAVGSIMVDRSHPGVVGNTRGNTDIGGFIGSIRIEEGTIRRCFSTGSVTGRSARTAGGSVGGVAGLSFDDTTIESSVALVPFVALQVGGTATDTNIGRINANALGIKTNNYAIDTLKLYKATDYNAPVTEVVLGDNSLSNPIPDANNIHGDSIQRALLVASFWRGLGYTDTVWDLGTPVTKNGWPTLRNVGGQQ
jgi:hypothetical protein